MKTTPEMIIKLAMGMVLFVAGMLTCKGIGVEKPVTLQDVCGVIFASTGAICFALAL